MREQLGILFIHQRMRTVVLLVCMQVGRMSPQVGDVVAAPFSFDDLWYRARVDAINGDSVDLYYVDYGDNCIIEKHRLRPLRCSFLITVYPFTSCGASL